MHFESVGDGPAILLLHAFPFDGRMWSEQVRDLAPAYRVLVPDMPGFGVSPRPDGNPSLDDWAKIILARCKRDGVEKAVVAGCSMGGYLAFAMNRLSPGFAAAFALIDTRASADSQDVRRNRYEMVERARHEGTDFLQQSNLPVSPFTLSNRPEVVARLRAMMADATPVGVMAAQRAMASRKDSRAQLSAMKVPVTVVYGIDDPVIPRAEVESMTAAIPGASYVPLDQAGHLPPIESPAEVTKALSDLAARAFAAT